MQTLQFLRDFGRPYLVPTKRLGGEDPDWGINIWKPNPRRNYAFMDFLLGQSFATGGVVKGDPQPYQQRDLEEVLTHKQFREFRFKKGRNV